MSDEFVSVPADFAVLASRMGEAMLRKRLLKQAGLWSRSVHQGSGVFILERFLPFDNVMDRCLRLSGLAAIGRRNCLDVQVTRNIVRIPGLPEPLENCRLLQIADLHCDLLPELVDVVIQRLQGVEYDVVVLTGDYHNKVGEVYDHSLELMGKLIPYLKRPRYAVLGNHDFLEKVPYLERDGLRILLNEAVPFERGSGRLWICGVDDPHFFQTADLKRAREAVPEGECAVLLAHSPEPFREAAELGYSLMLSGHTHGGQICLPGGISIIRNTPHVPRHMLAGAWSHHGMQGYTSRGTGVCGVAARFFCPPEITLHVLKAV